MMLYPQPTLLIQSGEVSFDIGVYTKSIDCICFSRTLKNLFISLPEECSLNSIANNLCEETDHFINISSSESCCEKCNELKNEVVIPNCEEIKEKREKDHIQKFLKKINGYGRLRKRCISSLIKQIDRNKIQNATKIIISKGKKQMRNKDEKESYRGSQFRGVSINGNRWQVFVIIKNKKYYAGIMNTEIEAAKLYDKLIILHEGLRARTNFSYTIQDVRDLISLFTEEQTN